MQRLGNPFPLWNDLVGALLDAGYIYIGVSGADPETSPIAVYWDEAKTQPAQQPLRTRGGYIVNGATPAFIWIDADDYSIRVRDADGGEILFAASIAAIGGEVVQYQPLDGDLTSIAAQANSTFGLSLLTVANAAALKTLAGIVDALAKGGGTVTGNILRSGAGPHLYHDDDTFTSGRVFVTANGAADPTSAPGDVWIELEA